MPRLRPHPPWEVPWLCAQGLSRRAQWWVAAGQQVLHRRRRPLLGPRRWRCWQLLACVSAWLGLQEMCWAGPLPLLRRRGGAAWRRMGRRWIWACVCGLLGGQQGRRRWVTPLVAVQQRQRRLSHWLALGCSMKGCSRVRQRWWPIEAEAVAAAVAAWSSGVPSGLPCMACLPMMRLSKLGLGVSATVLVGASSWWGHRSHKAGC